jgi:hypothetical protein
MNINRHNYEEYFILYLDNELNPEERGQVELFAQANPDLQQELSLLLQTRLMPDESVGYEGKELLLHNAANSTITFTNYEEWLLLYVDQEVTPAQKTAIEQFAAAHSAIAEELYVLQQTKSEPEETIVFANKESLFRSEETTRRVLPIAWRRIAIAAILLLAISLTSLFIINSRKPGSIAKPIAFSQPDTAKTNTVDPLVNSKNQTDPADQIITTTIDSQPSSAGLKTAIAIKSDGKEMATAKKTIENTSIVMSKDETSTTTTITDPSDEPTYQPKMKKNLQDPIASFATLTKVKENTPGALVTSVIRQPSLQTDDASSGSDDEDRSEKKNRFRGFLRKVTRTFEKNTNIKATDENDRLLVAGMAIKL